MAREIDRLTAIAVRNQGKPGLYSDGGGLYLQVTEAGAKTWVYRFMLAGKRRDMGLGAVHTVGLADARDEARRCRQLVRHGFDPINARRTERLARIAATVKPVTFRETAERYIKAHQSGWKNPKHAAQWPSTLEMYVYPALGALPVNGIDTPLIMKVLEPIWAKKPETASRVRGRLEVILDAAIVRGERSGPNPARWKGHLDNLLAARAKVQKPGHHAALPYDHLGAFMASLRTQDGVAARALEFTILTATRTSETLLATWDEFDAVKRLWTIPGERMKAGREHRVPLSDDALVVLARMKDVRHSAYVFPGLRADKPMSNMAMLMTLRRMKRDDLTAHGFRSTFSDWCAEQTAYPPEVREMALAHSVGDKTEAAYRRGDLLEKRVRLMADWAAFCSRPSGGNGGNIFALRA